MEHPIQETLAPVELTLEELQEVAGGLTTNGAASIPAAESSDPMPNRGF
ncbi:MAG: hypothetical protein JO142_06745 [Burkholderiales bacterium]|nr:hypothetical protein [Burkholderiales bacterium]